MIDFEKFIKLELQKVQSAIGSYKNHYDLLAEKLEAISKSVENLNKQLAELKNTRQQ